MRRRLEGVNKLSIRKVATTQSGNPAGRAQGSRTKSTLFAEAILENDREGIMDAVVNAAKNGDPTAMRLCVERLVPLRKGRPT
ncbi:MAG TPA: DUF5681 domain-containing protein [Methylocella sp.]|jgi:Family of unknown function (DUF5681)|nr:DUF5681 domain-containing protein [Methylocella sp.]